MDSRELGGLIWRIGFLGLLCSFAWWGVFYLTVTGDLDRMLPCLISSAGPCSFANWMIGRPLIRKILQRLPLALRARSPRMTWDSREL